MWIIGELLRLVVRVAIGFAVALVIAVLWATVSEHSFAEGLRITTLSVGVVLLLMAGIGRGSNFERAMDYGVAHQYWGRIPGISTIERKPEDPTLAPGAVFALTGLALLALVSSCSSRDESSSRRARSRGGASRTTRTRP